MNDLAIVYLIVGILFMIFMWVTDKHTIFTHMDHFFMVIIWPYFVFVIIRILIEAAVDDYQWKRKG